MSGLFSSPKVQTPPPPPTPPAPPTVDASAIATREDADAFRRRQGTQANIKSTSKAAPTTMASQLLGS